MNPHILYWKWNDDVLNTVVMEERTMDIIKRSVFDYIYISLHSVSDEYRLLSCDETLDTIKKCVELFKEHGRKVVFDAAINQEHNYIRKSVTEPMYDIKYFIGKLDENGEYCADCEGADGVLVCAVADFISERYFKNEQFCEAKIRNGNVVISAGKENAGRDVLYYLSRRKNATVDYFSDEFIKGRKLIFEKLKDLPLGGAATDEIGPTLSMKKVQKTEGTLEPLDALDINKLDFCLEWFPYSAGMAKSYKERYGASLDKDILYFRHINPEWEEKSYETVNRYFENMRLRIAEIEKGHYELTKEYFGEDAFVGVHPTWWGDELDLGLEGYHNGFNWWEVQRDYAQTDELVLIPIRLAMSRKCEKNIWYNMWYSMRSLDIKSYHKETYTNLMFGGRTHYLGYECYEPGVVLCLNGEGLLEEVSTVEEKVKELDKLQNSSPDSRVLIIFGYESTTNHLISDPDKRIAHRRGEIIHSVLKTTKELFMYPYLCDLVPSTEIDNGFVEFGETANYCGHEYDAVVLLYPDGITQKAYEKFKDCKNLIVCGNITRFHDGKKVQAEFENADAHFDFPDAKTIAHKLIDMGVAQNCGENFCVFCDGSITVCNRQSTKPANNGVECAELDISRADADIVYISPDGQQHVI